MHSAFEPLLTAADKMPFEVEPVYLKLSYYKAPAEPAAAARSRTDNSSPCRHHCRPGCSVPGSSKPTDTTHSKTKLRAWPEIWLLRPATLFHCLGPDRLTSSL